MSMPEHHDHHDQQHPEPSAPDTGTAAVRHAAGVEVARDTTPTRTTRAVSWLGWHVTELSTVVAPAGVAAVTSPWVLLVSAAAGLRWGVHEWRARRAVNPAPAPHPVEHQSGKDGEQ